MKYTTGALKNPIDNRDIQLASVQAPTNIPAKYITDISMLPVLDQKQLGACVGHSLATVMAYQNFIETGKYEYLSPRFIYGLAKLIDGYNGQGTMPRVAASVAVKTGCASDSIVKNDTSLTHEKYLTFEVTDSVKKNAITYKSGGYAAVAPDVESIKQAIYANGMITMTIGCGTITSNEIKPGTTNGYHSLAFYGYETKNDDTIFYYRNSWTKNWGDKGNGTLSAKAFAGLLLDPIVLTDIPNNLIEEARTKYKYFSDKEIVGLKPELVQMLDKARGIAGIAFKITSGLRTKAQNTNAGGVEDSSHLTGLAVDIACTTSANRYKIVTALLAVGFTRIGIGQTFVHADIDTDKAGEVMWDYYSTVSKTSYQEETNNMKTILDGKKTYIGIAILALGALGVAKFITDAEVGVIVDSVLKIVGVCVAVYGRYNASK